MIKVLGIPFHFGQQNREVARAPQFLRQHGLIPLLQELDDVVDLDDLSFEDLDRDPQRVSRACQMIQERVFEEASSGDFVLSIGGDHGMSLGTISGLLRHDPERVVIWVDAHGDINTPESSTSKNFHGMPLSYLLGLNTEDSNFGWIKNFLSPKKIILFGPRDLDPFESSLIKKLGIQCYSSSEMMDIGAETLLNRALKIADPNGQSSIHLSFDVDVFDCNDFQSTGISLSGGPSAEEIGNLVSRLNKTTRLKSMDLVEYNPGKSSQDENLKSLKLLFDILIRMRG